MKRFDNQFFIPYCVLQKTIFFFHFSVIQFYMKYKSKLNMCAGMLKNETTFLLNIRHSTIICLANKHTEVLSRIFFLEKS